MSVFVVVWVVSKAMFVFVVVWVVSKATLVELVVRVANDFSFTRYQYSLFIT